MLFVNMAELLKKLALLVQCIDSTEKSLVVKKTDSNQESSQA